MDRNLFNAKFYVSVRIDKGSKEGSASWSDEAYGNCVQDSLPQIVVITQIKVKKNLLNLLICENFFKSLSAKWNACFAQQISSAFAPLK